MERKPCETVRSSTGNEETKKVKDKATTRIDESDWSLCTVQEPFEMKVVTEAQLEAKYGKGKLKAVWSDIK